jgi:hypothetical protein
MAEMDKPPTAPYVNIYDIANTLGITPEFLTGDISACIKVVVPLENDMFLLLQTGETPDHYRCELHHKPKV